MKNIKSFSKIFESSPRIPRLNSKGLNYWKNKGKNGKDVMIYTHDDMDGIYSAVVVKERMLELGYNIKGYGIINYQEGWGNTSLDSKMINVAVDFANMPDGDGKNLIDIYIDHHGEYSEEEKEFYKDNPVIKTKTGSAYEGICRILGKTTDEIILYSIDMIDSAKYDEYNVDWRDTINFSWKKFKEISKREGEVTIQPFKESKSVTLGWGIIAKLTFAAAFNQYLKRADHKTLIETIHNLKNVSIYNVFQIMKRVYPGNNKWQSGDSKDFVKDGEWRIGEMQKRTRGKNSYGKKKVYTNQTEFVNDTGMKPDGYQIIGSLMWIPSGVWANAIRGRAILLDDIDAGIAPDNQVKFIALQYGTTIQVCSIDNLKDLSDDDLPTLKGGKKMRDLGKYMSNTLRNFQKFFGYDDPDTTIGEDEITVSGGHVGIGSISNIGGSINNDKIPKEKQNKFTEKYNGHRYLDLMRNKIIGDLSEIEWNIGLKWPGGGSPSPISGMISDIINRDKKIQDYIKSYVEKHKEMESRMGESEWKVKKYLREELKKKKTEEEITKWHDRVMKDHKVMMKKDIRQMDNKGNFSLVEGFNKKKMGNMKNIKTYEAQIQHINRSDLDGNWDNERHIGKKRGLKPFVLINRVWTFKKFPNSTDNRKGVLYLTDEEVNNLNVKYSEMEKLKGEYQELLNKYKKY